MNEIIAYFNNNCKRGVVESVRATCVKNVRIFLDINVKKFLKLEPSLKLLHSAWMMLQAVKV